MRKCLIHVVIKIFLQYHFLVYHQLQPMAVNKHNRLNAQNVLQDEEDELRNSSQAEINALFDAITESIDKPQTANLQGPNILPQSNVKLKSF